MPGPAPKPRAGLATVLMTALGLAALGFVIWGFVFTWRMAGDVHMSVHGWIALVLAFVLVGALGGGLMWLSFYSSRKGFDEAVHYDVDEDASDEDKR